MKKTIFSALILVCISFMLFSCKGVTGETGPTGPAGASDPTGLSVINIQENYFYQADDTCLDSSDPDNTYGDSYYLYAENDDYGIWRPVFRFDTASVLPAATKIEKAYLTVFLGDDLAGSPVITPYALNTDWVEDSATWNSPDGSAVWTGGNPQAAIGNSVAPLNGNQFITFELNPAVVQGWINTPGTNYGILLDTAFKAGENYAEILSSNYGDNAGDFTTNPILTLYYK